MRIELRAPRGFRFETTVRSHGWAELAPTRVPDDGSRLETVLDVGRARAVAVTMRPRGDRVVVELPGAPGAATRRRVRQIARRVLNLDLDLGPFYDAIRDRPRLARVEARGAGRLLRAPTTFEDLVKLVLTTNCSWALTRRVTSRLVERLGVPAAGGRRSFPRPAALARAGAGRLRDEHGLGYRAPYVAGLACAVDEGRLDPERWERPDATPDALRRELLELPGVGPYVAESLLKLMGRPRGLALDSWLRSKYAAVYHGGRRVADRTIARRYGRAGDWAGLALWCDMTADWIDGER